MHYRPRIAILNNLEFDHADIYSDLAAIQQQFHYLMRTIPPQGLVLKPRDDKALNEVVAKGEYSKLETMALSGQSDWRAELLEDSGSSFRIFRQEELIAEVNWSLIGNFNVENGLAAFAASMHAGVKPADASAALEQFTPVKRRLEMKYSANGITIYDDFAHHPTAIGKTITALKKSNRHQRIVVIMEFASYTMRTGIHADDITQALASVDVAYILKPHDFSLENIVKNWKFPHHILQSTDLIIESVLQNTKAGDALLIMSNRGFDDIHHRLINVLRDID